MVGWKEMKIEITGSDYNEVLALLAQFPTGKITAKNGSAFWECTNSGKQPVVQQQHQQINQQPQQRVQSANPFLRAFDSMAERF